MSPDMSDTYYRPNTLPIADTKTIRRRLEKVRGWLEQHHIEEYRVNNTPHPGQLEDAITQEQLDRLEEQERVIEAELNALNLVITLHEKSLEGDDE